MSIPNTNICCWTKQTKKKKVISRFSCHMNRWAFTWPNLQLWRNGVSSQDTHFMFSFVSVSLFWFHFISFHFPSYELSNSLYMLLFIHYQLLAAAIGDKNYLWAVEGVYRVIREQVKVSIYCSEYGHGMSSFKTLYQPSLHYTGRAVSYPCPQKHPPVKWNNVGHKDVHLCYGYYLTQARSD